MSRSAALASQVDHHVRREGGKEGGKEGGRDGREEKRLVHKRNLGCTHTPSFPPSLPPPQLHLHVLPNALLSSGGLHQRLPRPSSSRDEVYVLRLQTGR